MGLLFRIADQHRLMITCFGGILSNFSPIFSRINRHPSSESPEYSYGVFFKQMVSYFREFPERPIPEAVGEFGPGDSITSGLAALVYGVKKYFAFDVEPRLEKRNMLDQFDAVMDLFRNRTYVSDDDSTSDFPFGDWPRPKGIPASLVPDKRLNAILEPSRLQNLRRAVHAFATEGGKGDQPISYHAPWQSEGGVKEATLDILFSQKVFEHIDDLATAYRSVWYWLKPGGVMQNQIDFRSHEMTREWNGQYAVSPGLWRIMRGRRTFFINRVTPSAHVQLAESSGFLITQLFEHKGSTGIRRADLDESFRGISDEDLATDALFMQAMKPQQGARS